jgi:hypothetical protein
MPTIFDIIHLLDYFFNGSNGSVIWNLLTLDDGNKSSFIGVVFLNTVDNVQNSSNAYRYEA